MEDGTQLPARPCVANSPGAGVDVRASVPGRKGAEAPPGRAERTGPAVPGRRPAGAGVAHSRASPATAVPAHLCPGK